MDATGQQLGRQQQQRDSSVAHSACVSLSFRHRESWCYRLAAEAHSMRCNRPRVQLQRVARPHTAWAAIKTGVSSSRASTPLCLWYDVTLYCPAGGGFQSRTDIRKQYLSQNDFTLVSAIDFESAVLSILYVVYLVQNLNCLVRKERNHVLQINSSFYT